MGRGKSAGDLFRNLLRTLPQDFGQRKTKRVRKISHGRIRKLSLRNFVLLQAKELLQNSLQRIADFYFELSNHIWSRGDIRPQANAENIGEDIRGGSSVAHEIKLLMVQVMIRFDDQRLANKHLHLLKHFLFTIG